MAIHYLVAADNWIGRYRGGGMPEDIQNMINESVSVAEQVLPGVQDVLDASDVSFMYDPRNRHQCPNANILKKTKIGPSFGEQIG